MGDQLTPKFLTPQLAEMAVGIVLNATLFDPRVNPIFKRPACHIVVLAPAIEDARDSDYPDYPNYPTIPFVIYERSVGKTMWSHPFDNIARCKAQQLWREQNIDGRTDSIAHLLFPGDTPYWGGVKREGIVVACSGVQPWFDQMISGMVADTIKGLARDALELSQDKVKGLNFLS